MRVTIDDILYSPPSTPVMHHFSSQAKPQQFNSLNQHFLNIYWVPGNYWFTVSKGRSSRISWHSHRDIQKSVTTTHTLTLLSSNKNWELKSMRIWRKYKCNLAVVVAKHWNFILYDSSTFSWTPPLSIQKHPWTEPVVTTYHDVYTWALSNARNNYHPSLSGSGTAMNISTNLTHRHCPFATSDNQHEKQELHRNKCPKNIASSSPELSVWFCSLQRIPLIA